MPTMNPTEPTCKPVLPAIEGTKLMATNSAKPKAKVHALSARRAGDM
jgi:hypothetical protein